MSPKPTELNTVTVKYSASKRVIGSVNARGSLCSMRKYTVANDNTNSGTEKANAVIAVNRGYGERMIARVWNTMSPATTHNPEQAPPASGH